MGRRVKVSKIILNDFDSFLGMKEGCLILRDRDENVQRYPLFEEKVGDVFFYENEIIHM